MRYSQILVENRRFNIPHLYLPPPSGVTRWNIAVFGNRKLDGLPFHVV